VAPELSLGELALRLAVAAVLTGTIGLERELRERAAGLRTHMLVGTGSALFTIVSAYGWVDFTFSQESGITLDPSRVAAQVVTGIGFLGAGAIIRQGASIRGLTTAAGLWVVAAIGMAAGAGYYSAALIGTGIVLVGLGPIRKLEGAPMLRGLRREVRVLELNVEQSERAGPVLDALVDHGAHVARVEFSREEGTRKMRVEVDIPAGHSPAEFLEAVSEVHGVTVARWGP
jgi:putative Mg2+ transporter-C (MgtC) family protein